tara:strand:+ start:214 stop:480 length:267 start_codon:yes stop_codon:yes gene_type:complete
LKVIIIALIKKSAKIPLSFYMIKSIFKVILLILLFGFMIMSPKIRYMVGISLKQISSYLLWTVSYEDREKWIIDKPSWIPTQKIKPSY